MDVVYASKESKNNEELIYSLRSLANFEHENVYIVGGKPKKIKNVIHIERYQKLLPKDRNIELNLKLACLQEDLSESFVYMNDDIFFLVPQKSIPALHNGPISRRYNYYKTFKQKHWMDGLDAILDLLKKYGIADPFNYEMHTPMVMEKSKVLEMLEIRDREFPDPNFLFHLKTFYGNYFNIGGRESQDVKVSHERLNNEFISKHRFFLSTNDETFKGYAGDYIKAMFPDKSPYG